MSVVLDRIRLLASLVAEYARSGVPETTGSMEDEVVFIVDGVGRFQAGVMMVRRALRAEGVAIGTVMYDWQTPVVGEIFTDLMWLKRNRLMGAKLARKLVNFRRAYPGTRVHVLAFSGGCGVAVFALERLAGRGLIDTLVFACPAMSRTYNFGATLRAVNRCYALISHRDSIVLGFGTGLLGTTDRQFEAAGGRVGFVQPADLGDADREAYGRFLQSGWTPALKLLGHSGGHSGYGSVAFLRKHLLPLLRGEPLLEFTEVPAVGA